MSTPPIMETPLQRIHRVCSDAAERVVRELYSVNRQKEPPATLIAFARSLAVSDYAPPPHIAAAMEALDDGSIAAAFSKSFRPKIAASLVNVRPS